MFDVFIFTDIEMPFNGREKVFCVLEQTGSHFNALVRELSKQSPTAMQIWTGHTNIKEEGCLRRKKESE